jgi:hypothetical protein
MGRSHWMWTHRYVMQQKLGRPLLRTERVHHINRIKSDNRPENLEIWDGGHPHGMRKKDKLKQFTVADLEDELKRRRGNSEP